MTLSCVTGHFGRNNAICTLLLVCKVLLVLACIHDCWGGRGGEHRRGYFTAATCSERDDVFQQTRPAALPPPPMRDAHLGCPRQYAASPPWSPPTLLTGTVPPYPTPTRSCTPSLDCSRPPPPPVQVPHVRLVPLAQLPRPRRTRVVSGVTAHRETDHSAQRPARVRAAAVVSLFATARAAAQGAATLSSAAPESVLSPMPHHVWCPVRAMPSPLPPRPPLCEAV